MSYLVFARKYRPLTFEEIIGQEHIARTLKNAIAENRVAHAYLFSGPRGVGKTTTARILAKALNCKNSVDNNPCGKCDNCLEITSGSSLDVLEIDGASNRGIDEIRALRENVKFAPASSKYKIYIIDEAHQITDAAFNALLKTLEEPPEHVVFILATTEPQKIPITILSRCQCYRFRLLSSKEIMSTLQNILDKEGLKVDSAALQVITSSSGGSLRDALSLLDQAVSYVSGNVTFKDMQSLLGFLPKEIIYSVTEAIYKQDSGKILSIIKEVTEQGYSLLQFARDLREHFRRLMLLKVNPDILEIPDDEKLDLEKHKSFFSVSWIIRSGHILSKALDEMKWSDQSRLILELYILKLAQPYESVVELVDRLEKLQKLSPNPVIANSPASNPVLADLSAPSKINKGNISSDKLKSVQQLPIIEDEEKPIDSPIAANNEQLIQNAKKIWKDVVSEIHSKRPLIANLLSEVVIKGMADGNISIEVSNRFQEEGIKRNKSLIEDIIKQKFGDELILDITLNETDKSSLPLFEKEQDVVESAEESAPADTKEVFKVAVDLNELKEALPQGVDKILEKFPGKVTRKTK